MIEFLKVLSLALIGGIFLSLFSHCTGSTFLDKFLDNNLIVLLVALLAINGTTISIIMTKLREISEKNKVNFSRTISQLRLSICEQLCLILSAVILEIAKNSNLMIGLWKHSEFTISTLISAVFVYAIYILYDTTETIFVILKHENKE